MQIKEDLFCKLTDQPNQDPNITILQIIFMYSLFHKTLPKSS